MIQKFPKTKIEKRVLFCAKGVDFIFFDETYAHVNWISSGATNRDHAGTKKVLIDALRVTNESPVLSEVC